MTPPASTGGLMIPNSAVAPQGRPDVDRATRVIDLPSGPVEYRLDERGPGTVLMLHGGHMRAGLPLGEEVFADAGYFSPGALAPGLRAYSARDRHLPRPVC